MPAHVGGGTTLPLVPIVSLGLTHGLSLHLRHEDTLSLALGYRRRLRFLY